MFSKENNVFRIGFLILIIVVLLGICAPVLSPYDPVYVVQPGKIISPGSVSHLLGTDAMGRDMLSRVFHGIRYSMGTSLLVLCICLSIGVPIGLISGFYGGWIDMFIMRLVDLIYSFPFFVLAITTMAILGSSFFNLVMIIGLIGWSYYARLVRGQVLSIKESDYLLAAKMIGISGFRLMFRHILPNCINPVVVSASFDMGKIILSVSSLSYLGLGIQEPKPEWGLMLRMGVIYLRDAPHMALIPGIAIFIAVLSFNLIGDGLRNRFDLRN